MADKGQWTRTPVLAVAIRIIKWPPIPNTLTINNRVPISIHTAHHSPLEIMEAMANLSILSSLLHLPTLVLVSLEAVLCQLHKLVSDCISVIKHLLLVRIT